MPTVSGIETQRQIADLGYRFGLQHQFAVGYSPLYAALFGTVAGWLTRDPEDPVVQWLVEATTARTSFEITNLLAAALHYEVLRGSEGAAELAAFYPSVGGNASSERLFPGEGEKQGRASTDFIHGLRSAILACKHDLASFIQTNSVQTNESGRGICWLLPLLLSRWNCVNLLDLGASAGLNLIADQLSYQLRTDSDIADPITLGAAKETQFRITSVGWDLRELADCNRSLSVLQRIGCDRRPYVLANAQDEMVLASFIWADQLERLQRLRQAIASFRQVQRSDVPVQLFQTSLPEDLPAFLDNRFHSLSEPLIIYNTFIKMYLPRYGSDLRHIIAQWAGTQQQRVIWLQWEPPKHTILKDNSAPQAGWLAWTADLWHNKSHYYFHLAWVHPHGLQVEWLPGLRDWISFWSPSGA